MSTTTNKTIVITTVNAGDVIGSNNDRLLLSGYKMASILSPSPKSTTTPAAATNNSNKRVCTEAPARKRQRLDHLSCDEKLLRRKLKNRVAAQSARDRKKAQMSDLEVSVVELQKEKEVLLAENKALKEKNSEIEEQNRCLKLMLEERRGTTEHLPVVIKQEKVEPVVVEEEPVSVEYASLISVSQQQRQGTHSLPPSWMMPLIFCQLLRMMMAVIVISSMSSKNSQSSSATSQTQLTSKEILEVFKNPKMKWWGPQQKTWNPSKN